MLACRDAIARNYALTRPQDVPDEPVHLSRAMLESAASDYDRLTGGRLSEHAAASPPADGPDHGAYPFAWSVLRLRDRIDQPGWTWFFQDDDAMAAMYVTALHHLMLCWGPHPLLARLAAPLGRGRIPEGSPASAAPNAPHKRSSGWERHRTVSERIGEPSGDH